MALVEWGHHHHHHHGGHGNGGSGRHFWQHGAPGGEPGTDEGVSSAHNALMPAGHSDWTDILVPRGQTIWDMNTGKLKTAAVAFTFVSSAGFITLLAGGGLVAIMLTGAMVTFAVLSMVLLCTVLVAVIVTGVPIGYGLYLAFSARRTHGPSGWFGGGGGSGGGGGGGHEQGQSWGYGGGHHGGYDHDHDD